MRKLNKLEFLPLFVFLMVFSLFFLQNINTIFSIDIHSIQNSNSVIFEIESVQELEDSFFVTGKCFDSENAKEYNNWITGNGVNIYQNIQIFVYDESKAYKVKTYSSYDSLQVFREKQDIDLSLFTFSAEIPKKYEGYKIGVVSKNQDGTLSKILSERKIYSE